MIEIVVALIVCAALYWFFILRPGRLDFWKTAAKYPNSAYDHFMSNNCWRIFEDSLPENYRNTVPKAEWTGPFRLVVPKLGNKMIYVFGNYPHFEHSQNDFLNNFNNSQVHH